MPLIHCFDSNRRGERMNAPYRRAVVAANQLTAQLPALRGRTLQGGL
jgi:hypothetical protein